MPDTCLFTYLAKAVPQLFVVFLGIGTHFCGRVDAFYLWVFRVLLQQLFLWLTFLCLFTCSLFLAHQMSPLPFKTQCGLFPRDLLLQHSALVFSSDEAVMDMSCPYPSLCFQVAAFTVLDFCAVATIQPLAQQGGRCLTTVAYAA